MQDLTNTLEESAKGVIDAAALGTTVYTGQSADTVTLPSVVLHASTGDETPLNSGNFKMELSVMLKSSAPSSTLAQHRTRCTDVFGVLMADDLATSLSTQTTGFHALGISNRNATEDRDEDSWVSTLSMDIYCCLTDLV